MYFKFDENEEDSDDDLYNGRLPDTEMITETKCEMCVHNERIWGKVSTDLYTKKQAKEEIKKYYNALVQSGTISMIADLLVKYYPKQLNNYHILEHLLSQNDDQQTKAVRNKIEQLFKLEEQIAEEKSQLSMAMNKKKFTREMIDKLAERKRISKIEKDKESITESLLSFRRHLCDPKCAWCKKHCDGTEKEHIMKGKLCDCKCNIFPTKPC